MVSGEHFPWNHPAIQPVPRERKVLAWLLRDVAGFTNAFAVVFGVPQVHLLDLLEVGGINRDGSSPIVYKMTMAAIAMSKKQRVNCFSPPIHRWFCSVVFGVVKMFHKLPNALEHLIRTN